MILPAWPIKLYQFVSTTRSKKAANPFGAGGFASTFGLLQVQYDYIIAKFLAAEESSRIQHSSQGHTLYYINLDFYGHPNI